MHPNINLCLLEFIKKLEKKLKLNRCSINTIIIRCKILDSVEINSHKCHALVHNLNGNVYQCTRKKKYSCFCGLHHNRKNDFKTISHNKSYDEVVYRIDTNKMVAKKMVNYNDLYKVHHNYTEYFIESSTGTIYIIEYDDNCEQHLVPIDNINTSNLPFTIT